MSSTENFDATSMSLIDRVRSMDHEAWHRLADLYGPLVYKWIRQAGLQPTDAADVSQEVFRVVMLRIEDFRRQRVGDSFRGWLWGITRNKLREHFRHQAKLPVAKGGSGAIDWSVAEETIASDDFVDDVNGKAEVAQAALRMLQPEFKTNTWECFERTVMKGHMASEVARDLGMTDKAVRQAKYRVIQRLRRELEGLL